MPYVRIRDMREDMSVLGIHLLHLIPFSRFLRRACIVQRRYVRKVALLATLQLS